MAWDPEPRAHSPREQLGYDAIGSLVRNRRDRLGWSQRTLEARCGIDQTVISRIENGKQYGVRWARFATLVGVLGGLGAEPYPDDVEPAGRDNVARCRRDGAAARPPMHGGVIDLLGDYAPGTGDARHSDGDEWPDADDWHRPHGGYFGRE
jgi:transcriptional regulator with XRE-family HTH domain